MLSKLRMVWAEHFLALERLTALGVTAVVIVLAELTPVGTVVATTLAGARGSLYSTLASILGTLLGFVVSALAILIGFTATPSLKVVRDSRHYPTLWTVFTSAIRWFAAATVAAIAALVLDREPAAAAGLGTSRVCLYAVVGTCLVAAARLGRCIWVLEKIVTLVSQPPPPPPR